MSDRPQFLTREGLNEIQRELEWLKHTRRKEIADLINQAKELGTTVNNAQYDDAKRTQSFVEGRIQDLEAAIHNARVIDHDKQPVGTVGVGSRVLVVTAEGDEEELMIVGHMEANPLEGKISNESPVGQALMGRKIGDKVQVKVPAGVINYTIKSVE